MFGIQNRNRLNSIRIDRLDYLRRILYKTYNPNLSEAVVFPFVGEATLSSNGVAIVDIDTNTIFVTSLLSSGSATGNIFTNTIISTVLNALGTSTSDIDTNRVIGAILNALGISTSDIDTSKVASAVLNSLGISVVSLEGARAAFIITALATIIAEIQKQLGTVSYSELSLEEIQQEEVDLGTLSNPVTALQEIRYNGNEI